MYRYEEYDFEGLLELRSSSDIDPNDPELLYAMAQCYVLGKGVTADRQIAREFLREAARAGSEAAQEEMEGKQPAAPAALKRDYSALGTGELSRLAEEEHDLQASLLMYRHCRKIGDRAAEIDYLCRCTDAAMDEGQDLELRREVFEEAGAFYKGRNDLKTSRRFYEAAKELESVPACRALLDYYSEGLGGPVSEELAADCLRRIEEFGEPEDIYQCALRYLRDEKRSKAYILLERLMKTADTPRLKGLASLRMHELDSEAAPCAQFLPDLWAAASDPEVQGELRRLYREKQKLPATVEQVMYMAGVCQKERDKEFWLRRAAEQGNKKAEEQLRKLQEERARREAEEAERRRKEAEEKARREAEEAERRRKEAEERARREAEEAERRRKEAEEKARREAEEAEHRRKEAEEKARREAEEAERRRKEEEDLHRRAEEGDAEALLTLGDRLAALKPKEARSLWLRGAEKGSGLCCLRLADMAFQEENYTYVVNMCKNAVSWEPSLETEAEKLTKKAAAILQKRTEEAQRMRDAVDGYVNGSVPRREPQLALCVLALALVLAGRFHLIGGLAAPLWAVCGKLLVLVLTVCTLRAVKRYRSAPELPGAGKKQVQALLRTPLIEQAALTLLCALTFAMEQGSMGGLVTPYFWGLCLTVIILGAARVVSPGKGNPLSTLLAYALGRDIIKK